MRVYVLAALIAATFAAGCSRSSQSADPAVQAALDAGSAAIATVEKCVSHMKANGNANAPECNASEQMTAYRDAKLKVTTPGIPAIEATDEKLRLAMFEATALVSKLSR